MHASSPTLERMKRKLDDAKNGVQETLIYSANRAVFGQKRRTNINQKITRAKCNGEELQI